jgi:serine/threonine protein kinase
MNIPQTICPACFSNKGTETVCGTCSYDENERRSPLVLPHRTVLNGQFLVGKVLGKPGGFGITYLAMDLKLKVKVAIKEYLPRDLAGRDSNHSTVYPHSKEDAEFFAKGLDDFLKEAQNLAQFDHANIVRVRNFFKENDTAYIVMDYYDGITLNEYVQRMGGKVEWQMAIKIMTPIMDALREVHAKGFLHRDIKPHNIYLTRENRIILLDFGSARQAMGERSKSLSMVLTPGFAPFEQYHRRGNQGPWTDVYGVAATLYFMIMGEAPPEANERVERDHIQLPSQVMISLPQSVEKGLMKGLAVKAGERFESIRALQGGLFVGINSAYNPTGVHMTQNAPLPKQSVIVNTHSPESKTNLKSFLIISGIIIFVLSFAIYNLPAKVGSQQMAKQIPTPTSPTVLPTKPVADEPKNTDFSARISQANKIVTSDPQNVNAWISLGNDYFDTEQTQKAIHAYGKALEIDPDNPNVLTDQGVMLRKFGLYDKALSNFERALKIDPNHKTSLFNAGVVYAVDLKDQKSARPYWKKYLEIDSTSPSAIQIMNMMN